MGFAWYWRKADDRRTFLEIMTKSTLKLVWTNGCFDILHVGHVRTFEWARAKGEILIVGINSDSSVRKLKGPGRPVVPEGERAEILTSLRPVNHVVIFDEDTPSAVIKLLRPAVIVKGEDWRGKRVAGSEYAGRVEFAPLTPCVSTTLKVADCERAWRAGRRTDPFLTKIFLGPIAWLLRRLGLACDREW